jgi:PAS domain S-box-containing protein
MYKTMTLAKNIFSKNLGDHPYRKLLPFGVFMIGMLITVLIWHLFSNHIEEMIKERFSSRTNQIIEQIVERLYTDRTILRGAAALFDVSGNVSRKQWRTYIEGLQIREHYPGMQGIGFSKVIRPSELQAHISTIRAEGFPDYTVWPEGRRTEYSSVIYLEPFDERNQRAFGYDMFSEPVRRAAMEKARDTGNVTITGKVKLLQETDKEVQNGFLMYVPVYKKGMPLTNEQEKRQALLGYVYSPFRINNLINSIFKEGLPDVDLEIYDGEEISKEAGLYDFENDYDALFIDKKHFLAEKKVMDIHGHKWTFYCSVMKPFIISAETYMPSGIFPIGSIISVSLAFLLWSLERSRAQALEVAAMSKDMRLLLESTGEGIYGIYLNGCCTFINMSAVRMLGYDVPEDLLGQNMHEMIHHSRADGSHYPVEECPIFLSLKEVRDCSLASDCHVEDEVLWRKDRTSFHSRYSYNPIIENGVVRGSVITFSDITERKQVEEKIRQLNTTLEGRVMERTADLNGMIDALQKEIEDRKEIERKLLESEDRYRRITESVTDYIYSVKVENGAAKETVHGQGCLAITGYSSAELSADPYLWLNMVLSDDRALVLDQTTKILTGTEVPAVEHRIIRKDGTERWVKSTCVPKYDDKGRIQSYDGLVQDITAQKREEANLLLDRDYLGKMVAERTAELEREIAERKRNQEIIAVRMRLLEFAPGHTLEELLRNTLDEIGRLVDSPIGFYHFVASDQKTIMLQTWSTLTLEEFCRTEGKGLHYNLEEAGVWADCIRQRRVVIHNDYVSLGNRKGLPEGHAHLTRELVVPVFRDDRIVAVIGVGNKPHDYTEQDVGIVKYISDIAWEITENKRVQDNIVKLSRAVENSPVIVVITNRNGIIEYVNPKFTEVTGYTAEEAIGQSPRILNSGRQPKEYYKGLWTTILSGKEWRGEFCNRKKNGELHWEHASISSIRNIEGVITHFVAIKEDITEQKRISDELVRAKKNAEAANTAKSEFLANMSHELRTPLNSIIGFSEVLQDEFSGPLNEQQKDYLNDISTSGKHLLFLINDILDLSKVEAGKMEFEPDAILLKELLKHSLSMLKEKASKNSISLKLEVTPEADIEITADERKLKQIMFNLLSNAVKFTPEGGSVRVTARRVSLRGEAEAISRDEILRSAQNDNNGNFIEISVEDTGIGIKPEDMPKLFHEFSQLESAYTKKYEGSGLGLALTQKLVKLHGGDIRVESEFGRGSAFVFAIPLKQSENG